MEMDNQFEYDDLYTVDKRYLIAVIIIAIILLLSACDSPVGFTEAQPSNQPDLDAIPEAYRGMFICQSDSILVKVEEQVIYSEITEMALTPMSYITEREDCKIINDSLYIEGHKECVKIEYVKDGHIAAMKTTRDTIFRLTSIQKARLYKGNLILSQITENDLWTIAILEMDGEKGVRYRAIVDDSDLQTLSEITSMSKVDFQNPRYPQYKVTPKEVELDQLFEDPNIFIDCEYFSRIRLVN